VRARGRENEIVSAAAAAISAGPAATRKICRMSQCKAKSQPPISGPTIDPIRPMPSAQPTPVDRMAVGYDSAVSALAPICPPTTQNPAPKMVTTRRAAEAPTVPISTTKALAPR